MLAAPRGGNCEVVILQDGKPLTRAQKTADTRFRTIDGAEPSYIVVQQPRMYALVDNHDFGVHTIELRCGPGLAAFAFTFTSCIDPAKNDAPDGVPAEV